MSVLEEHEAGHDWSPDPVLLETATDRFGAECELAWLAARGLRNYTSEFLEHGYHIFPIPEETAQAMRGYFKAENRQPITPASGQDGYFNAGLEESMAAKMNQQSTYYGEPDADTVDALNGYFGSIADELEAQMAMYWEITNVRAWAVKPDVDYGPNVWHTDGFSRYVRKLLIFVNPPSEEAGTTEITSRTGDVMIVESSGPVCVLYDTNVLSHRGRSPRLENRPIIEVTLAPAEKTSPRCVFAGQLGRVPVALARRTAEEIAPSRYAPEQSVSVKQIARSVPSAFASLKKRIKDHYGVSKKERKKPAITNKTGRLNLGGGRRWSHRGWINLEGVAGEANPYPFLFSPEAVLPVPSSTILKAYSSHCLEHLDDPTVKRVLSETRRTMNPQGSLVIKVPDFDETLARWRAADESYFRETWQLYKVTPSWENLGVEDTIDNRAAYIFCGFWNAAFGHNFIGKHNRRSRDREAYNGPPLQAAAMADELKALDSPHEIAMRLRQAVIDNEVDFTFNHQNGWSREEMRSLLAECGFEVKTFETADIVRTHADIPGIELMQDISMYCEAVPV